MPEAGKGSCLQPHLSIEGREGAGLFLQEEKSYGCEKRRLKIPRGPGRSLGRDPDPLHVWGKGGSATRVALWPPASHGGRMLSAPQGEDWGGQTHKQSPALCPWLRA